MLVAGLIIPNAAKRVVPFTEDSLLPYRRLFLYRMETGKVTSDMRVGGTVAISIDELEG